MHLCYSQPASLANRKKAMHNIGLRESLISSEICTERNSFLPSNKSCKSPLVMWKHIHSELSVLLRTRGHISQRIKCGTLGSLPGISVVMNQGTGLWLQHPDCGRENGETTVQPSLWRDSTADPWCLLGCMGNLLFSVFECGQILLSHWPRFSSPCP